MAEQQGSGWQRGVGGLHTLCELCLPQAFTSTIWIQADGYYFGPNAISVMAATT